MTASNPPSGASSAGGKPPIWKRCLYGGAVLLLIVGIHQIDRRAEVPWLATGVVLLLGCIGAFEFPLLLRSAGHAVRVPVLGLVGSVLLIGKAGLLIRGIDPHPLLVAYIASCWMILSAREVLAGEPEVGFPRLCGELYGVGYLVLYSFMLDLLLGAPDAAGVDLAIYLVLVSKSNDIGGYLVGSTVGGRKLAPRVSPNKTWSGSAGGLLLCIVVAIVGSRWLNWPDAVPSALLFALLVGVATQFGDLSESLIKRACRAKDSAQLVPTFGGALDIVDSLVFAAPVGYWVMRLHSS